MKKIILSLLVLTWLAGVAILIAALTNTFSANIFQRYPFVTGIGFIALTGFIRMIYRKLILTN